MNKQMIHRQPFLNASDYIFYLQLHIEEGKIENYNIDNQFDGSSQLQSYTSDLPKLSELLRKLVEDLQLALDKFVNEFLDNEGIYYLLNLLRLCLNRQQSKGTNRTAASDGISSSKNKFVINKERNHQLKRALNDEYDTLLCLNYSVRRNSKALHKIVSHQAGLSTLASCIVSNLIKSRLIALQLLTKVCSQPEGVQKVLDAMSTMRIIFGESVRFKFLVAMLNSGNCHSSNGIECNVLSLLNALLSKTINVAERIRLQCEFEEAGFDVNNLEKILYEKRIPSDDLIWTELKKMRKEYIDVIETVTDKKLVLQESNGLKLEVENLQKALTKLEEDKINLMTIERELKEKCEDLEQEVDHLKTKFNDLIPSERKAAQRPGSDKGTGDSGQWSDSDGDTANTDAAKVLSKKMFDNQNNVKCVKNSYNVDQNMRNEEEFIYIPAIHPPPDFEQYAKQEAQLNGLPIETSISMTKRRLRTDPSFDRIDESRWRQRQRHSSSGCVNEFTEKPTIVNVHPKQQRDKFNLKYSDSTIGMDRENSELILNWKYSAINPKYDSKISALNCDYIYERNISKKPSLKKMSNSMNQINNLKDSFESKNDKRLLTAKQFQVSNQKNNSFFDNNHKSIFVSSKQNFSQSNGSLYTNPNKQKSITSSLQSYFFSGSLTPKHSKSLEKVEESLKSFPIPKTYRKNFILKGHGNCGLYSGHIDQELLSNNLSDDVKNDPYFDNISTLVHREIAEAAKDIGAWI